MKCPKVRIDSRPHGAGEMYRVAIEGAMCAPLPLEIGMGVAQYYNFLSKGLRSSSLPRPHAPVHLCAYRRVTLRLQS